jgi:lipopolysaccharide transport system ATP-binding protein
MSKPIIDVRHVSKRYQLGAIGMTSLKDEFARLWSGERRMPSEFWALRDVSFEVQRGDVVGLIGRNGNGKSTLLKILSRITRQTSGEITLRGRVASLLEVGTGFHPDLSGRDNIFLNGTILGMTKAEIRKKFDEIVAFADVEAFVDTPVKRYSSGMYVRLAFAVAAHLDPEILIVDEVLAVGDVEFQRKCLGKMDEVSKSGRTILFVSHNMAAVRSLCTRALLLDRGAIRMRGAVDEVVDAYVRDTSVARPKGTISWHHAADAPGDERARLATIRVVAPGVPVGDVDIERGCVIEVDYWNFESGARRLVSVHLTNAADVCVLTSANTPSVCLDPDPWFARAYPAGLFRTRCTIPGHFLNEGEYRVSVFVNDGDAHESIALAEDVVTFTVVDTRAAKPEYKGPWRGCVRPKLDWKTEALTQESPRDMPEPAGVL